jgi:uncharacterized tellurite resistance protein B-like protein
MISTDFDDDKHHLVRDAGFLTDEQKIDSFVLTPPMVLTSALMYLMLAEGEIGAAKDSGSGFVTPLLQSTKAYVHAVPLERFLQDAPSLLSVKERLSVLVNVSDAMVADGHIHEAEQLIFGKLTVAFGINPKALETFLEAITAKNNKASLGEFDGTKLDIQTPSPHVGLAAAVIKAVMSPDGSVAAADLDRLEGLIGEYDGLLEFSLEQAPTASSDQLFETLAETLNRDQKLFVLTNVFEAMQKEGEVEAPEKSAIFETMRAALGFTESAFKPIVLALKAKSAKSAATRDQTGTPILQSVRSKFERKPKGHAKANAPDAGNSISGVIQVGGPSGTMVNVSNNVQVQAGGRSFVFDTTSSTHRASEIRGKLNISRQEIRGNSARRDNFAKPGTGSAARAENRATARVDAATARAQARLKLETTKMQLESTRAANAEIRARMDQPLDSRKKANAHSGAKAKAVGAQARNAQQTSSASSAVGRQALVRLDKVAALLPLARLKQPQPTPNPAEFGPPLHKPTNGLESGANGALSRAFDSAKGKLGIKSQNANHKEVVLEGANFSDPDLMWRFALPALLVLYWLWVPAHGSLLGGLPSARVLKTPCWLSSSLMRPMQIPGASAVCWSSPRMGNGHRPDLTGLYTSAQIRVRPQFLAVSKSAKGRRTAAV